MDGGGSETDGSPDPSLRHRLPYTVSPRRYDLHLAPDLQGEVFAGSVTIEAEAHAALDEIVLHAQELSIGSATVTGAGRRFPAETATDPVQPDRIVLRLPQQLPAGPLRIEIAFSGELVGRLSGLYRSTFTGEDGTTRAIATTQFEATDARRAFPCFDEPDRKAVFAVSVDVPAGLSAYSNAPARLEEPLAGGGRRIHFADTMPMSTYLVALVVGPLAATEPLDVDGTPVRVVHVPGKEHLAHFALEAAAHSLRFFTEWFGLPYPAAKLDLVAVPDFAFGAMENLGCVIFRETTLLVDMQRASRLELERVAEVVAHEIAHMWFGDLVTMRWWNGIWLNEAFASLMEMFAVDDFRPQWERWVTFGVERDRAMGTDALHSTRPVEYPVGSPDEAQGMFDVLTYQKGAGVLRMLERYIGPEAFRRGIRRYLADHQLGNTETADLWDALEDASGEPVRRIMDGWILQGGFPVVTVTSAAGTLSLRRQPFTYAPARGPSAVGDGWSVPVLLRTVDDLSTGSGDGPNTGSGDGAGGGEGEDPACHRRVLVADEAVAVDATDSPVVVNAGGWGFYRVRYDRASLDALVDRVERLETLERYNLLSDTWAELVGGAAELGDFLRLAEAMRTDTEPGVWRQILGAADFLDHVVDDGDRGILAEYVRVLVSPALTEVGWDPRPGDNDRTATLRSDLLRSVGTVGADPEVRRLCLDRHAAAMAGGPPLDPDLAPAVVAVVARAGAVAEFDAFVARHRNPATPQEAVRYLRGLALFEDRALADRAFTFATTEARSQDGPFAVYQLLANRVAGADTWSRIESEWATLENRFPPNLFPNMIEGVRALCRDAAVVEQVRDFLAVHPVPGGQRTVDQAVERMEVNLVLAQRLGGAMAGELSAGVDRLAHG